MLDAAREAVRARAIGGVNDQEAIFSTSATATMTLENTNTTTSSCADMTSTSDATTSLREKKKPLASFFKRA